MTGPSVEQVECVWCPCGKPGPWVARCCGRILGPADKKHRHLVRYFDTQTDAWLHLSNHAKTEHGIDLPLTPPAAAATPTATTAEPVPMFGAMA